MSEPRFYTVRPFSRPARTDLKDIFRVYLSPASMLLHKLYPGAPCILKVPEGNPIPAIAWNAPEKIQETVVQTSKSLQALHSLKLGDKISVQQGDTSIEDVHTAILLELARDGSERTLDSLDASDRLDWEWSLKSPLKKAEYLCPGMILESIEARNQKRTFKIDEINFSRSSSSLYRFVQSSTVRLQSEVDSKEVYDSLSITEDGIGGLTHQIRELNKRLADYSGKDEDLEIPSYYRPRRGGILLHGPPGTGKSLILRKVSEAKWKKVISIDEDTMKRYSRNSNEAINLIFADALNHQPSVLIIDSLESKASISSHTETVQLLNIAQGLINGFGRLNNERLLVIAATTSLSAINSTLRQPGRFETEIEIPVPDWKARGEILKILSHLHRHDNAKHLEAIGDRTHGFVGADLDKLVHLAARNAVDRARESQSSKEGVENNANEDAQPINPDCDHQKPKKIKVEVTQADLDEAMSGIQPTAMQGVFLETPKVYWSDIGGQAQIHKSLQEAVEWPLKVIPPSFNLFGPFNHNQNLTQLP